MLSLLNSSGLIEDHWTRLADDESIDGRSRFTLSLSRLKADWHLIERRELEPGVELEPTSAVDELSPYLEELALVVLNFPSFADGRAFSQARLLRSRYGYPGEIRAVGEVVPDQIGFMLRCGISQFQISEIEDVSVARQLLKNIPLSYQPELTCA